MKDTPGTLAVSQRSLSPSPDGKSLRPLGRDVAAPSETKIDELLCENFVLKSMVEGLIFNMMSGDSIILSMYRAEATCKEAGLRPDEFLPIIQTVLDNYKKTTRKNPISRMF
jgi:hypothetical protein